jgi:SAM-dependent methyltransferase
MDSLSYAPAEFAAKEKFVGAALGGATRVLDVGCNTGTFSLMAARGGAEVVAIDYDAAVVDRVWREASRERLNVLPLVVNLARPTPATGWRNGEAESFLERAAGRFDLVLMLAVIHHMLVTERVPLEEIMSLTAELTTCSAVVEYVDPADPMFRQIARGRDHLHADLNAAAFVRCAERWFAVEEALQVSPTRRLFRLQKR